MEKLLNDFSLGLFVWQTLLFVILVFFLRKYAWKPILNAVEEREEGIKNALDSAEKAKEEMENLNADNERILAEARLERDNLLKEAREMKNNIINEAKDQANTEADKIKSQYNITKDSELPDISRFSPVAQIIGLRPGDLCEIKRPSKTGITTLFYRICSA